MNRTLKILSASALIATLSPLTSKAVSPEGIGKNNITLQDDKLTPEALWAMGRIGTYNVSPDGKRLAYQVTYYSVEQNRSNTIIYVKEVESDTSAALPLMEGASDPTWLSAECIAYLSKGEVWTMKADGTESKQVTNTDGNVEGFLFAPNGQKVILIKQVPYTKIIQERPADLPKSTGRLVTDLMYRHWDHYVESIPHPFVLDLNSNEEFDILEGKPYECPMEPFGGVEQLAWSPDSKFIAFTCRTKTGLDYSVSTDSDIFLYDVEARDLSSAKNLCKEGQKFGSVLLSASSIKGFGNLLNPTKTFKNQIINTNPDFAAMNVGYDQNPQFSPDGRYVAWLSMERDGYESDRNRICVYDLKFGTKQYVTESFDSSVDDFCWAPDSRSLYFIGVWHATENLYRTDLKGKVVQLTNDQADFGSIKMLDKKHLIAERHDYFHPADLYLVNVSNISKVETTPLTAENSHILSQLASGTSEARWTKTTDGKDLHYWVIKPPHFDPSKKYPTLLFCEGGPQSPVSQFWSYRWNFFIMASQGYVIIAPNRRGLPGFGQEWLEQISGDWTGQCMNDYLSAIDDAANNLPYVDRNHLGAVGASFGGFSVYYLAGHHDKRFKCFIAHDGAFNLEAMYTETEENWFSNWEYEDAYWNKDRSANADKTYKNSPHLFVDKWDTPILCIHGEKDYRINATQGMSAFNAARMRGIEAQLLIFPDENHWVLKPQNGILWQRTYFNWLDRWLK